MHVLATAGHVDHGKSTLVRALTGREPDRLAEEQRRGLTIDLGFAWTTLPSGRPVAFVDVPGHERFVATMLAGVGPVPAAVLVVAADGGWMPQTAEHVAALDAFAVQHGVLVVTRSDLADPAPALAEARERLAGTSLAGVEAVVVSATTGAGLPELRAALDRLAGSLPEPPGDAPVRLWVDRAFSVRGAGTVVTGTLGAGTVHRGDRLVVVPGDRDVVARGVQSLERSYEAVSGTARVALNLRNIPVEVVGRGAALVAPDRWTVTDLVDVRAAGKLPREVVVHVGSAAVPAAVRPLGADLARLRLRSALPLHVGDRLVLRDPGSRRVVGATALDVAPPPLARRGAAAARKAALAGATGRPDAAEELRRRGVVHADALRAMGVPPPEGAAGWLLDPERAGQLAAALSAEVSAHAAAAPLEPGLAVEVARRRLGLPHRAVVEGLAVGHLMVRDGRVVRSAAVPALPAAVSSAVAELRRELGSAPYAAPDAHRLRELGLGAPQLAAAVRVGELLKVSDEVWLAPGADAAAADRLAALPQPFTAAQARDALGTTRRVVVPLLELLDSQGRTRRLDASLREVLLG